MCCWPLLMCDRIVIRPQSAVTIAVNVWKVTKMKVIQQCGNNCLVWRKLCAHSDIWTSQYCQPQTSSAIQSLIPLFQGDQPRPGEMLSSLAHRPGGQGGGQSSVQGLRQHPRHHTAGERGEVPDSEEEVLPRVLRRHLLPGQCDTQWICGPWIPGLFKPTRAAWRGQHLWRGQNNQKATLKLLSRTSLTKQVTILGMIYTRMQIIAFSYCFTYTCKSRWKQYDFKFDQSHTFNLIHAPRHMWIILFTSESHSEACISYVGTTVESSNGH